MSDSIKDISIEKIFEELNEKAKQVYPTLLEDVNSFSNNQVAIEELEKYRALLNQTPTVISSNRVKC